MTSIKINTTVIDRYLKQYDAQISECFAPGVNYTSITGKQVQKYLGDRRVLSVDFEPMETSQINSLFTAIRQDREKIKITYIDPLIGNTTKEFTCKTLPAATYFVADNGKQYWTIPTITFEETDESAWGAG